MTQRSTVLLHRSSTEGAITSGHTSSWRVRQTSRQYSTNFDMTSYRIRCQHLPSDLALSILRINPSLFSLSDTPYTMDGHLAYCTSTCTEHTKINSVLDPTTNVHWQTLSRLPDLPLQAFGKTISLTPSRAFFLDDRMPLVNSVATFIAMSKTA